MSWLSDDRWSCPGCSTTVVGSPQLRERAQLEHAERHRTPDPEPGTAPDPPRPRRARPRRSRAPVPVGRPLQEAAEVARLLGAGVRSVAVARRCASAVSYQHELAHRALLPREHGSERGYQQHRYDDTPACAPCLDAHAEHNETLERRSA